MPLILHLHAQQQATTASLTELTGQQPDANSDRRNVVLENVGSGEKSKRNFQSKAFK